MKTLSLAPGRLQSTIGVALTGSKAGGEALLEAVSAGKASARLLQERSIELQLRYFGASDLDVRLSRHLASLPPADAQLQDLLNRRKLEFAAIKPGVATGAKIFEEHCAHAINSAVKGPGSVPSLTVWASEAPAA